MSVKLNRSTSSLFLVHPIGRLRKHRITIDAPRAESKGAKILDLIGRAKGATLAELMKTTGWQGAKHTRLLLDRREEARHQHRFGE